MGDSLAARLVEVAEEEPERVAVHLLAKSAPPLPAVTAAGISIGMDSEYSGPL